MFTFNSLQCRLPLLMVLRWLQMSLNRLLLFPASTWKKTVCTVGQKWIFDSLRAPNSKRTFGCLTAQADNMEMKIWTVSPAAPIVCWGLPSCWRKQQCPLELVTLFRGESLCRSCRLNDFPKNPFRFPERIKRGRTKELSLKQVI